jgi:hypothetical protein
MANCSEQGNESSNFVQGGEFVDQRSDCHLEDCSVHGVSDTLHSPVPAVRRKVHLVEAGYKEVPWFHCRRLIFILGRNWFQGGKLSHRVAN